MPRKTVVLLSGGVDSTVLAATYVAAGDEVIGLAIEYGQRHMRKEIEAARKVSVALGLRWESVYVPLRLPGNSQTDASVAVPEGHPEDAAMKLTVVPNRNMVMLSIAASVAMAIGAARVAYGAHAGDAAIYCDCREDFVVAFRKAIALADDRAVTIDAPFTNLVKKDIVRIGDELQAPLALTYTCYRGGPLHCGRCGACRERRQAFTDAGIADPAEYERV